MDMMPTMNLRFVDREMTSSQDANGDYLPDGYCRTFTARVLQQRFVSLTSPDSEWRDVPLVALGALPQTLGGANSAR
jgi:hypothetical protein